MVPAAALDQRQHGYPVDVGGDGNAHSVQDGRDDVDERDALVDHALRQPGLGEDAGNVEHLAVERLRVHPPAVVLAHLFAVYGDDDHDEAAVVPGGKTLHRVPDQADDPVGFADVGVVAVDHLVAPAIAEIRLVGEEGMHEQEERRRAARKRLLAPALEPPLGEADLVADLPLGGLLEVVEPARWSLALAHEAARRDCRRVVAGVVEDLREHPIGGGEVPLADPVVHRRLVLPGQQRGVRRGGVGGMRPAIAEARAWQAREIRRGLVLQLRKSALTRSARTVSSEIKTTSGGGAGGPRQKATSPTSTVPATPIPTIPRWKSTGRYGHEFVG